MGLMVKVRYADLYTGMPREAWCPDETIRPFGGKVVMRPEETRTLALDSGAVIVFVLEEWTDLSQTKYAYQRAEDGRHERIVAEALCALADAQKVKVNDSERLRVRCGFAAQGLGTLTVLAQPLWEVIVYDQERASVVYLNDAGELIAMY